MRVPRTGRGGLWLGAVFLLALALRCLPWPAANRGGLRLLSPDCYGHLRRAHAVARHFPRVPVFDAWLNHPDGGVWIWPPGLDLLVGGTARLLHGPSVSLVQTERVAAALPPLLGALQVLPLFALARRAFGRRRARVAALAYAVVPAAVLWSCYGHADQHVLEALALLAFLAAAARILDPDMTPRARVRRAVVAGLALGAALLAWQGSVLTAGLGALWSLLVLGPLAPVPVVVAALVAAAAAAFTAPAGRAVPFSFVSFGWFQPLLVAAMALPLALRAAADRRTRRAALALALVLAAALAPFAGRIADATLRGGGYLARDSAGAGHDDFSPLGGYLSYPPEWIATISESQPLLRAPLGSTALAAVRDLSAGLLLLPFALVAWGAGARRRGASRLRRGTLLLLVVFGAPLLALTLLQRRNVYYLAVFTALALADGLARALPRRAARPGRAARALLPAAVLLVALLPALGPYRAIASYAAAPGHDVLDLLARLRALDPPPVFPDALPQPPPGAVAGVMAPWGAGHFVTAISGRPAGADPFGYGWRRQMRLFTTPDPEEAWRILRDARCRYLVTANVGGFLPAYAAAAGRTGVPPGSMFIVRAHDSGGPSPFPFLTRVLDGRTGARLADGRFVPQFQVFRVAGVADEPAGTVPP